MRYAACYNSNVVTNCSRENCDRPHYAKGVCKLHYTRERAGVAQTPCEFCGTLTPIAGKRFCSRSCLMKWHRRFGCYTPEAITATRGICSIEGCGQPVKANKLCTAHDMRRWRYGDPSIDKVRVASTTCIKCGEPREKGKGSSGDLCAPCYQVEYYKKNLKAERARRNARRRYLEKITPAWADREAIRQFYAACPKGFEVDHMIPVKNKLVCGLHVLNNLQYLSSHDNKLKLNKFVVHTS